MTREQGSDIVLPSLYSNAVQLLACTMQMHWSIKDIALPESYWENISAAWCCKSIWDLAVTRCLSSALGHTTCLQGLLSLCNEEVLKSKVVLRF